MPNINRIKLCIHLTKLQEGTIFTKNELVFTKMYYKKYLLTKMN